MFFFTKPAKHSNHPRKPTQKPTHTKHKQSIPKVLKDLCWAKHVGDTVATTKCMCCGVHDIKMNNFHCGHVIPEAHGGQLSVDNLRPICAACNLSMGTENMNAFRIRCGFRQPSHRIKGTSARFFDGLIRLFVCHAEQ
jgi:hypothetical protein